MELPRNVYEMLEAIVGPENISEDEAILDPYSYNLLVEMEKQGTKTRFQPFRPGAVILPGSVEEVQAIIKVCNRAKLKAKAFSTGWGPWNSCSEEGVLMIDLRRMNRILEIDEKNMFAVVEPYVSWAQLQAEIMKLGLNAPIPGVGCHTSALANVTSSFGMGANSWTMGFNEKNSLAVEWVLPSGDILKLGSLGSGAGWFSGDGPGLSLRGIMRGEYGALGGLGVITKCAIKLYHWPCPARLPVEGSITECKLSKDFPENIKLFLLFFNDREKRSEFLRRLGEEEMGYHLYAWGWGLLVTAFPELEFLMPSKPEEREDVFVVALTLIGNSSREMEYQEKVFRVILAETEGEISNLTDEPHFKADLYRTLARTDFFFLGSWRYTGGMWAPLYDFIGVLDSLSLVEERTAEISEAYQGKGALIGITDSSCQPMYNYSHIGYVDSSACGFYDPNDPATLDLWRQFMRDVSVKLTAEGIMRPSIGSSRGNKMAGPKLSNFHIWQEKIKGSFDPNYVSDASYYIEPE